MLHEDDDSRYRRLCWKCRRGMLELDLLLTRFMTTRYHSLDEAEKNTLADLLELEDPLLFSWFTKKTTPADPHLNHLIKMIQQS